MGNVTPAQALQLLTGLINKSAAEAGSTAGAGEPAKSDASTPADPKQKGKTEEFRPALEHPSASPAAPSGKPAEPPHASIKETQPSTPSVARQKALKKAEALSILYKAAKDMKKRRKCAAIVTVIRKHGLNNVVAAIERGIQ
jgi:hypothetical protein